MAEANKPDDVSAWQTGATVVDTGLDMVGLLAKKESSQIIGPAGQVLSTTIGAGANYVSTIDRYESKLGRALPELGTGFKADGEYDPEAESLGKLKTNTGLDLGKGLVLAGIGGLCFTLGPAGWLAVVISIPACIAGSFLYDKVMGRSEADDPLKIASALRESRKEGKATPEMVFALMVDSLEPESHLRKSLENRLKEATGTHKFHKAVDDPKVMSAVTLLMQDPAVEAQLARHYNVMDSSQFVARVTKAYNEELIPTRAILYPGSGDVAQAMTQDMLLRETPVVAPTMPAGAVAKTKTAQATPERV